MKRVATAALACYPSTRLPAARASKAHLRCCRHQLPPSATRLSSGPLGGTFSQNLSRNSALRNALGRTESTRTIHRDSEKGCSRILGEYLFIHSHTYKV